MFNNLLVYIKANIDKDTGLVMLEQVNSYKYLTEKFIQETEGLQKEFREEDDIEIFCILGNKSDIKSIEKEVIDKTNKIFEKLKTDNIETVIKNLEDNIGNSENIVTQRFCNIYFKSIVQDKLKFPRMSEMDIKTGITCLILYCTNSPQEEKNEEIDNIMQIYLKKEKPFFMGKQIMLQSFLLQDIKERKILAVLPDIENHWYALLEGGVKLYLNDETPYQREKISSNDVNKWTNLEAESNIKNPCYAYKKYFVPYELFEEWNDVFLYALATLPILYEEKTLEVLYEEFLEFIENNICNVLEADKAIVPKNTCIKELKINIDNIREYLRGKEEIGISKNMLILLKSRYTYLPVVYKIIERYYPEQVKQRTKFTIFENAKWKDLLNKVENEQNNYEKGIALEDAADYFINCIEGLKVTERRVKTENEEIDLACCNMSENTELWKMGPVIMVECKNLKEKVETKVIRNLSYIMDKKGIGTLLLFVKNNITSGAEVEVLKQACHNKYIIVFNLEELYKLSEEIKPIDLLISKLKRLEDEIEDKMENLM